VPLYKLIVGFFQDIIMWFFLLSSMFQNKKKIRVKETFANYCLYQYKIDV